MARFHGAQGKGALRRLREIKREEAQERDAVPTLHLRTKFHRVNSDENARCSKCEELTS